MELKRIIDPSIAKEQYEQTYHITNKLSYEKWVEYIETYKDYYVWYEDTSDGIHLKNNINKVPENFREGILLKLNKQQALAEYSEKKGYYCVIIDFHRDYGKISTTFQKKITKKHLYRLLEMANYLDALLLNNGTEVIDEKTIESLK